MVKNAIPKPSTVTDLTITLNDLVSARQGFIQLRSMTLKGGKGARRVGKLLAILNIEYDDYDKQTQDMIKEHGEKKPEGLGHFINPKNEKAVKDFGDAHEELLADTADLRFRKISMSDFGEVDVPMQVVTDLHMFFDFEEDEIEPKASDKEPEAEDTDEEPESTE